MGRTLANWGRGESGTESGQKEGAQRRRMAPAPLTVLQTLAVVQNQADWTPRGRVHTQQPTKAKAVERIKNMLFPK